LATRDADQPLNRQANSREQNQARTGTRRKKKKRRKLFSGIFSKKTEVEQDGGIIRRQIQAKSSARTTENGCWPLAGNWPWFIGDSQTVFSKTHRMSNGDQNGFCQSEPAVAKMTIADFGESVPVL